MKSLFEKIWMYIVIVFLIIVGGLLFLLRIKDKKLTAMRIQTLLIKTEEQANKLESQVKEKLKSNEKSTVELAELNKILDEIQNKKKELKKQKLNPKEVEQYWND